MILNLEKNVIRVLVAEDHTIVREGIKQLIGLAKDLLVVGEASNGEQLLDTLRHVPCEVVLLDISMPGVNGLEAIPRIRALNNPPAILVLSMHDEAQMAARALKVGAAGYATKDSDPALLLTAIRKVASGGRYIDPELADRMVFEVGLTDSRPLHSLLSEREFSVFERLAQGANVNDIAQQLALSSKTISTHKVRRQCLEELVFHRVLHQFRQRGDVELLHQPRLVGADGLAAQRQLLGDVVDVGALGQAFEH